MVLRQIAPYAYGPDSSHFFTEKINNWSLQDLSEDDFVKELLSDQPFIPKYFPFDVAVNKKGAESFAVSIAEVERREPVLD